MNGSTATCSGDLSAGIHANGPDIDTLDINNLTQNLGNTNSADAINFTTTDSSATVNIDLGAFEAVVAPGNGDVIEATVNGTGNVAVDSTGTLTNNGSGVGIFSSVSGNGNVSVTSQGNISTGRGRGIYGRVGASGDVSVTSEGNISTRYGRGIYGAVVDSGNVSIRSTGNVTVTAPPWDFRSKPTSHFGIEASRVNTGDIQIISTGDVSVSGGTNSTGILVRSKQFGPSYASGGVEITSTGNIAARGHFGSIGIRADHGTGPIRITSTGNIDAGTGIGSTTNISGNQWISSRGNITARNSGIEAATVSGTVNIEVEGGVVKALDGISLYAVSATPSTISILTDGTVQSTGVNADQRGIDITGGPTNISVAGKVIGGGGGAIQFAPGVFNDRLELQPGFGNTGTIFADGGIDTLRFGGSGNGVFDLGLIDTGTNTQQYRQFEIFEVTGGVWGFSGATTVDFTAGGGTVGGNAGFGILTANNGTTIAPGNSIGTITTGDFTANSGSTLQFEVNGAGNSDTIDATGTVTLNSGIAVDVIGFGNIDALGIQTTHILIDNDGTEAIAGTFVPGNAAVGSDGTLFSVLSLSGGTGNDLSADVFRTGVTLANGQTNNETVTFPTAFPGFTFTVNGADSATFSGAFSEVAGSPVLVSKAGTGTLTMLGDNSFTGGLAVNGGTLLNNGTLASAVTVNSGVFGGTGTSGGLIVNSGGTVAPGLGLGTMGVAGNVAFNTGSTFAADIDPNGTGDLLDVQGTVAISGTGTTLSATLNPFILPTSTTIWTLIDAEGGVTGRFATVSDNLPDIDLLAIYNANTVQLAFIPADGDVSQKEIYPSASMAALDSALVFTETMRRRGGLKVLGQLDNPSASQGFGFLPTASSTAAMRGRPGALSETARDWSIWGGVLGSDTDVDADGTTPGWNATDAGLAFGLERSRQFGAGTSFTAGLAGGYISSDVDSGATSAQIDSWHAGLYAAAKTGRLALSGSASYARHDFDYNRLIAVGSGTLLADGQADGESLAGSFEAFFDLSQIAGNGARFGPLATLDAAYINRDAFTETGAGVLNQSVASDHATQAVTGLGAAVSINRDMGSTQMTFDAHIAWQHAFGDTSITTASAIPIVNASFLTPSAPIDRNRLAVGLGAALGFTDTISGHIRYDATLGPNSTSHDGSAGLTIGF